MWVCSGGKYMGAWEVDCVEPWAVLCQEPTPVMARAVMRGISRRSDLLVFLHTAQA
jgi:hypothetical protein